MREFIKYQHIEKWEATEVAGIELGDCYVFPKIDGTNSSLWMDGETLKAGSRNRELSLDDDNNGFFATAFDNQMLVEYLIKNPTHRLFGEWLVPHSLKTYRQDAWRKFYIFDVCIDKTEDEILHKGDNKIKYISYNEYRPLLEEYSLDFIIPICKINNGSYEQFIKSLEKNVYLIKDGEGVGEGIVIKNYEYKNKYGRQAWAKIVTSEFKEKHTLEMGVVEIKGKKKIEEEIAEKYVTTALCEKTLSKIINEDEWKSSYIPRLLNTVYYDLIREDSWAIIKEYKNPTINFSDLVRFVNIKIKKNLPSIF